ncbi:hypothetical protein ACUXAV_002142 [Cupriavidus metallidurans]|nr:hypothetical protein AU374_03594 [Cupriavidus metallidurans]
MVPAGAGACEWRAAGWGARDCRCVTCDGSMQASDKMDVGGLLNLVLDID